MDTSYDTQNAAAAFRLLGSLFSVDPVIDEGGPELFDSIAAMDVDEEAEPWPFVERDVCASLLSVMKDGASGDRIELARMYRRLFIGPMPMQAPPYGSVYTDRDQVLFGEATLELRAWLNRVGIGIAKDEAAPEDHIGTMLSLLAWIIETKPQVLDEYLAEHLLTWAPHYLDELESAAQEGFYVALAQLTRLTLEGLREELKLEVVEPRFYR